MSIDEYGYGGKPPFSLYQNENGKWGLIDGEGNKLAALWRGKVGLDYELRDVIETERYSTKTTQLTILKAT